MENILTIIFDKSIETDLAFNKLDIVFPKEKFFETIASECYNHMIYKFHDECVISNHLKVYKKGIFFGENQIYTNSKVVSVKNNEIYVKLEDVAILNLCNNTRMYVSFKEN